MNDGFSLDSINRVFRMVPVSRVHRGYIKDYRRQGLGLTSRVRVRVNPRALYIYLYLFIYIYIYIEREREVHVC